MSWVEILLAAVAFVVVAAPFVAAWFIPDGLFAPHKASAPPKQSKIPDTILAKIDESDKVAREVADAVKNGSSVADLLNKRKK